MSKVAVVVSRRFIQKNGLWYTIGAAGPETGERYLQYFDEVTVCGRRGQSDGEQTTSLTPLDGRISVVILPCLASPLAQIAKVWECKRILQKVFQDVDAVVIRLGTFAHIASRLARKMMLPQACDVGGRALDGLNAYGSLAGKLYAPLAEYRARSAVDNADFVSYVTQHYLQRCYPPRAGAVIFAGSNVEIPPPSEILLADRLRSLDKASKPLVFGTIGSLSGRFKGIHLALEAFASLSRHLPSWHYRILGGGDPQPLSDYARRLGISENVSFDGTLPSGEPVLKWLDNIDAYLHPSLREGVPRAVIEAMSRACPVIATSVAGTPELLEPEDLIPANNVGALCRGINQSLGRSWRLERAQRNWSESRKYSACELGPRRDLFWREFATYAAKQSGHVITE
jgi:glycosyltransferase involved in cell wall biosynthesis